MRILGTLFALWAAASVVTAPAASADEKTVVVELFTSQGCSSCPPADALLAELDKSADVIALALHVDYWDYIGWKDSFADPENTERQRGYARAAKARSIFTPQMVIGGVDHVIGYKPMDVANTVQKHRAAPDGATVSARLNGDTVIIRLSPGDARGAMVVSLVGYVPKETVKIKRGENAGKTITYTNTVREFVSLGTWDGRAQKDLRHPKPAGEAAVVLVQKASHGPMVAAARVE
ncbi:DUF1223 domain-containing protein [Dinoroseobacter sp. PD6]|uniref:DUF1223 domain-containing protein n=1 Tax=Dinoroseobacter sp. PD6 TaxID=3028384 RepID=UPI00237BECB3|nr:DUF1223 domain-containing protein [Dinoroseobacter sp. PD6]MDD9715309.1 DUF1223 domain-containing protein [Dinoroseobacter sp. PD6]